MVKYKDKIIAYFDSCPDGVVAANELYEKEFSKMSEAAFFKALERLAKSGIIQLCICKFRFLAAFPENSQQFYHQV